MTRSPVADENLATLGRLFAAIVSADLEAVRRVLTPDVAWHVSGRHPLAGTHTGPDAVAAFFTGLAALGFHTEIQFRQADDARAVQVHRGWIAAADGGVPLDLIWILICRFEGGRIAEAWSMSADQQAADAYIGAVRAAVPAS